MVVSVASVICDLNIVMGQSNSGVKTNDGILFPVGEGGFAHPSNGAGAGAMSIKFENDNSNIEWKYFAETWLAQTGRNAAFVQAGVSNTSLLKAAEAWSPAGSWELGIDSLYDAQAAKINAALATRTLSPAMKRGRIYVHWLQGERDAGSINGTTITADLYTAALDALVNQSMADYGASKFLLYKLGLNPANPPATGWPAIQAAQQAVADSNAGAEMVWDKAANGTTLVIDGNGEWVSGWGYRADNHYSDNARRALGIGAAKNLAILEGF